MILILGDGLLGSWVHLKHQQDTLMLSHDECNIEFECDLDLAISTYKPDAVINCAGITDRSDSWARMYAMSAVNGEVWISSDEVTLIKVMTIEYTRVEDYKQVTP